MTKAASRLFALFNHGLPRHGEGGHAVQEAGSQSAQPAVAEPGVALHFLHLFHVQTELKIFM